MSQNNFSRSNVNERTLQISAPDRSSFDLSKRFYGSFKFGRLQPVRVTPLIPSDVVKGSLNPELQIENFATPTMGRMRLDTHTFFVANRRINHDWLTFIKTAQDGRSLASRPAISNIAIIEFLLGNLYVLQSATPGKEDFEQQSSLSLFDVIESAMDGMSISINEYRNPAQLAQFILYAFYWHYHHLAVDSPEGEVGWNRDFFFEEYQRLQDVYMQLYNDQDTGAKQWWHYNSHPITYALYEILKPWIGEGSIMDFIGYDIFGKYSLAYQKLAKFEEELYVKVSGSEADFDETSSAQLVTFLNAFDGLAWNDLFSLNEWSFETETTEGGTTTVTVSVDDTIPVRMVQEEPLRAVYACWYDYFRNYHLEKSTDLIDPDLFTSAPLLVKRFGDIISYKDRLTRFSCLLISRFRNYGRDMFTTIQPDDVYRHVAVPIMDTAYEGDADLDYIDSLVDGNFYRYDGIFSMSSSVDSSGAKKSWFPSGLFSRWGFSSSSGDYYRNDLQTMRRTGMLEKYLARNFYNPDTYSGYIEAHYGVKPVDFAILCSEYLGGDESLITGEQTVNPTETAQASAGKRTMVANASLTDTISYSTTEPGYLVSFVSIVPLPVYDARNPHLAELTPMDMPLPEFAQDTRVNIRTCDLLRNYEDKQLVALGFVPKYVQYRMCMDEAHGRFLTDYRSYVWLRDRYQDNDTVESSNDTLNAYAMRIHMPLDCFEGLKTWDDVAFGCVDCQLFADRALPAAIEFI